MANERMWAPGVENAESKLDALKRTVATLLNKFEYSESLPDAADVALYGQIRTDIQQLYPGTEAIPQELNDDITFIKNVLESSEETKAAMAVMASQSSRQH